MKFAKVNTATTNINTVAEENTDTIDSEYEPFIWLQSIENQNLAFLIIDPFLVCSSYEADIDDSSLAKIGVTKPEDVVIMTIVTVPQDGSALQQI